MIHKKFRFAAMSLASYLAYSECYPSGSSFLCRSFGSTTCCISCAGFTCSGEEGEEGGTCCVTACETPGSPPTVEESCS